MTTWLITLATTTATTAAAVAAITATVRQITWLHGLRHVLRDTTPAQRPAILHAYATTCRPTPAAPTAALIQRRRRSPDPGQGPSPP